MGRDELVEAFTPERILKKSAVFDVEKLQWLNGRHLAETPTEPLVRRLRERLAEEEGVRSDLVGSDAWMAHLVDLLKVRARTVDDIAAQARPYVLDGVDYDPEAVAKHWKDPRTASERLAALAERLAEAPWDETALEDTLRALADDLGIGAGKLIHPLRVALTGQRASPGIFDVLVLLGRERSLERLANGKAFLDTGSERRLG